MAQLARFPRATQLNLQLQIAYANALRTIAETLSLLVDSPPPVFPELVCTEKC